MARRGWQKPDGHRPDLSLPSAPPTVLVISLETASQALSEIGNHGMLIFLFLPNLPSLLKLFPLSESHNSHSPRSENPHLPLTCKILITDAGDLNSGGLASVAAAE